MYDIDEYAFKNGLNLIEITEDRTGYPRGLHYGMIGFEDIAEAEQAAKQINGEVVRLRRRDGHQFYTEEGWTDKPYDLIGIFSEEDNYTCFTKQDLGTDYLNDYLDTITNAEELQCTIRGLGANQFVLATYVRGEAVYDVMPILAMSFRYDVYTYEIGVVELPV